MPVGETIDLVLLSDPPSLITARVEERTDRGLRLRLDEPAPVGAAVKFEHGHSLFLAEVASCRPEGAGFAVVVEIAHALFHTDDLARLAHRLLEENRRR